MTKTDQEINQSTLTLALTITIIQLTNKWIAKPNQPANQSTSHLTI
jgi:hypothetical protein